MAITNGYTTGSAVKQALGIIDATSDGELELVIESVSRLIDDYCGRFFYQSAASTAFYTAQDYLVQPIDDFASVSAITTDGTRGWCSLHKEAGSMWTPTTGA